MFSRTTTARIAIGILLGVVLGVVLHESNTRHQPLALRGLVVSECYSEVAGSVGSANSCPPGATPVGNGCYLSGPCTCSDGSPGTCGAGTCVNCMGTSSSDSSSCPSGTFWSFGSCSGGCTIVPQVWPNCPGGITDEATCNAAYQSSCGISSSTPEYCCSGAGICEEVFLGLTTCLGPETSDSTCGGPCTTSSESTNYCCNVQTGNCETIPSSAPCIGDGGDCSGGACCGGFFCDSNMLCAPGTPE